MLHRNAAGVAYNRCFTMVTTVPNASDVMADRGYQTGKGVFGDQPRMRRIQDRTAHLHTYGFGSPHGDDLGVWNALSDQRVVRDHVVDLQDHKFQPRTNLPVGLLVSSSAS